MSEKSMTSPGAGATGAILQKQSKNKNRLADPPGLPQENTGS